ncbi:MAG: H-type lectin domain-containing protein [Pseudomonadota bacterium]|nr:H-type lectin domain-containing protein [Pseudomonadota bacterium]
MTMFKKIHVKVACLLAISAVIAAPLATAQSRGGESLSRQVQSLKTMLDSYRTTQAALNATQDNQINALTTQINSMNSCANNSMVYAPSNPASDANGCFRPSTGSITQGRISRPLEYTNYSGRVTFDTPFSRRPSITYSVTNFHAGGPCRGYDVHPTLTITNITRRGFDYTMPGARGGCSWHSTYGALWFASEDPVQVSGPLVCPSTTHSGATFPSRSAGTTHNVTLSGGCPSRPGQITQTNQRIVTGTCTADSSGTSATWGNFSSRQNCTYRNER